MIAGGKIRFIILGAAVISISLLYFFEDARFRNFFPRCPFYMMTGLFCPGCGAQRAFSSLLHLDIASAVRYNILAVAMIPLFMYSAYAAMINAFTGGKVKQRLFYSVTFARVVIIVVVLFWILRNVDAYPFRLLAPPA